jgi:hypothetical protein
MHGEYKVKFSDAEQLCKFRWLFVGIVGKTRSAKRSRETTLTKTYIVLHPAGIELYTRLPASIMFRYCFSFFLFPQISQN